MKSNDYMKFRLFLILFWLPIWVQAQTDTTDAAKNVTKSIFHVDSLGQINKESVKEIGKEIAHLIIFNLANNNVTIKLSLNGQKWSEFTLDAISKNIYRCDAIQNMYIIIDPRAINPIRAKICRNKKYKIYYDYQLQIFEIIELL